jgi:autotransporter-associated beta strand protein
VIGQQSGANGAATVGGGTGASTWTNSSTLTVGGIGSGTRTGVLNINTGGLVSATALDGGNATSSVNFDGGTLRITATDTASNTINLLAGGGTIDVPTAATTFTITSGINGAGGLTKTGGAKLTLTGANNYGGGTAVDNGTLLANNTTGSGTGSGGVTVNSGGVFGGTGSISGAVTVNAGGTLAPGASIESLDVGGLTLTHATSTLALELEIDASPQADLLNVTGGVSPGGGTLQLTFTNAPMTISTPQKYLVVSNDLSDAITTTFASITSTGLSAPYGVVIDYAFTGTDALGRTGDGNDLAIIITIVPEARAWLLVGAAALACAGATLVRKRL